MKHLQLVDKIVMELNNFRIKMISIDKVNENTGA